jgi:Inner membrane protein involved in colicin E2 resistance
MISIQGGQLVRFMTVGQDTHVEISADWASPSFQGSFLPGSSNITDTNFDAVWDINYLSRDIPLFWKSEGGNESRDYADSMFGVNFFRAIDTYSLNTRAVKYAILFLIVPFLTLFLLEVFVRTRIHPVPVQLAGKEHNQAHYHKSPDGTDKQRVRFGVQYRVQKYIRG